MSTAKAPAAPSGRICEKSKVDVHVNDQSEFQRTLNDSLCSIWNLEFLKIRKLIIVSTYRPTYDQYPMLVAFHKHDGKR